MKKWAKVLLSTAIGGPIGLGLSLLLANDDTVPTPPGHKPMGPRYSPEEVKFCFAIASFMSHFDGGQEPEELQLLEAELDKVWTEKFDQSLFDQLKTIIREPPTFETIAKMFKAIREKHNDRYRELLERMASADGKREDEESLFIYKMELLFQGVEAGPIFKVVASEDEKVQKESNIGILTYLTPKDVKKQFPVSAVNMNEYYLVHPANEKELLSIADIISSDFVRDKDTEVLEAMRIAGAKRVTISLISKELTESRIDAKLEAGANASGVIDFDAKAGLARDSLEDLRENTFIEVRYTGSMNGIFAKQGFLNRSVWVKNDAKFSWLFNARFQGNKVSSFRWEVEYQSIVETMISANIAVKCGLVGVGRAMGGASSKFDSEKLLSTKKLFIAEF